MLLARNGVNVYLKEATIIGINLIIGDISLYEENIDKLERHMYMKLKAAQMILFMHAVVVIWTKFKYYTQRFVTISV
jgi:hypothetical protein